MSERHMALMRLSGVPSTQVLKIRANKRTIIKEENSTPHSCHQIRLVQSKRGNETENSTITYTLRKIPEGT